MSSSFSYNQLVFHYQLQTLVDATQHVFSGSPPDSCLPKGKIPDWKNNEWEQNWDDCLPLFQTLFESWNAFWKQGWIQVEPSHTYVLLSITQPYCDLILYYIQQKWSSASRTMLSLARYLFQFYQRMIQKQTQPELLRVFGLTKPIQEILQCLFSDNQEGKKELYAITHRTLCGTVQMQSRQIKTMRCTSSSSSVYVDAGKAVFSSSSSSQSRRSQCRIYTNEGADTESVPVVQHILKSHVLPACVRYDQSRDTPESKSTLLPSSSLSNFSNSQIPALHRIPQDQHQSLPQISSIPNEVQKDCELQSSSEQYCWFLFLCLWCSTPNVPNSMTLAIVCTFQIITLRQLQEWMKCIDDADLLDQTWRHITRAVVDSGNISFHADRLIELCQHRMYISDTMVGSLTMCKDGDALRDIQIHFETNLHPYMIQVDSRHNVLAFWNSTRRKNFVIQRLPTYWGSILAQLYLHIMYPNEFAVDRKWIMEAFLWRVSGDIHGFEHLCSLCRGWVVFEDCVQSYSSNGLSHFFLLNVLRRFLTQTTVCVCDSTSQRVETFKELNRILYETPKQASNARTFICALTVLLAPQRTKAFAAISPFVQKIIRREEQRAFWALPEWKQLMNECFLRQPSGFKHSQAGVAQLFTETLGSPFRSVPLSSSSFFPVPSLSPS